MEAVALEDRERARVMARAFLDRHPGSPVGPVASSGAAVRLELFRGGDDGGRTAANRTRGTRQLRLRRSLLSSSESYTKSTESSEVASMQR